MSPDTPKRIYIIAGEASGDLHGSNLVKALKAENQKLEFRFWGGDLMQEELGKPVKHIKELAFMGFIEVLMNLRTILSNISFCKQDIQQFKPDAIVLIDYPGFNLRIAEWAKSQGIKVYYYISPQVWAWKQSRVHKIKRFVDHMFVILPFEKAFYQKFDFDVEFVGHPLLDAIEQYKNKTLDEAAFRENYKLGEKAIIAVLPGSRKQEIRAKLPIMLEAAKAFPEYEIVVAGAPSLDIDFYIPFFAGSDVKIIHGKTYDILSLSEAAIVTSGTATLETALFEVPEVVCYKASSISYAIAKRLVKIKFISLVNLIMDREVVKELIQHECNAKAIEQELKHLVKGGSRREEVLNSYKILKEKLGSGGASQKVAQSLLKTI
ncbi:MAG: lipid-A-disaccharide synthase [Crocinitomicaceae bacterium]|jgi:lipid-A-disaccharide synthase|nr:lipid-A-disaccharide synthase [Crocinitomicaceae bacterium]